MAALMRTGPRWAIVATGLYAGFTLVALAAWALVGDAWWNQLVNLTTLWWALPSVPLLLLAVGFRRWGPALLLLVPLAVLTWAYGGLFVGPSSASAVDDLRIASFNVWFRTTDVVHVADLVAEHEPDVLLLQEVDDAAVAELRDGLGALEHGWFGEPDFVGGVGVLSRFPVAEVREIETSDPFERPTAVVVLEVPADDGVRRLQVVPVHLMAACPVCGPFVDEQRAEVASRARETDDVLAALAPEEPAVVGGDLNGTRRSQPYRMLTAAGFRDPHSERGFGLGLTYPADHGDPRTAGAGTAPLAPTAPLASTSSLAHLPLINFPVLRLDHVLVRDLVPSAARVGAARGSDHRPVLVDVGW